MRGENRDSGNAGMDGWIVVLASSESSAAISFSAAARAWVEGAGSMSNEGPRVRWELLAEVRQLTRK